MTRPSIRERFDDSYIPEPNSGCWLWDRGLRDYGALKSKGKMLSAHRLSWELHCGSIPKGLHVLHRCDVPLCVNPGHLFLGTNDDNMADMVRKRRAVHGARHPRTHLTEDTIRAIRVDPRRQVEIAAEHGIYQTLVSKIKNDKSWKHLDLPPPVKWRRPEDGSYSCKRGHPWVPENIGLQRGHPEWRMCLACERLRTDARRLED